MPAQLFLHQLPLGPMENFIYLVGTEGQRDVVVVDPAWDVDAIEKTCVIHGKRLCGILLTHCHKDHTNGVGELLARRDLPVYASRAEVEFSDDLKAFGDALRPLRPPRRGPGSDVRDAPPDPEEAPRGDAPLSRSRLRGRSGLVPGSRGDAESLLQLKDSASFVAYRMRPRT